MIVRRKLPLHRVLYERLEERSLLTLLDLAALAGRVFRDAGGNDFDPGEEVSGAEVELHRDDGDGTLDDGDTLVGSAATNAGGDYRFDTATTNVRVIDLLPSGSRFVRSSSIDYDSGTGLWNVGSLAAGQIATLSITAQADATGRLTNAAEVSAVDQFDVDSIPANNQPTEDDQASATIVIQNTALSLVTRLNGEDANAPTGPYVPIGGQATFTYLLSNAGSELLELTALWDDSGTPHDTSDDIDVLELGEFLGDDGGALGALDPHETWTYALEKVFGEVGQYTGAGGATARVMDAASGSPSVATDSDPAHAFVFAGGVRLEVQVNGQDANSPGGALVPVGSQPVFTYLVRNIGNVPLRNLTLIDDNGTPNDPLDDLELRDLVGADLGLQGALDPGETWTFSRVKSSFAPGEYAGSASVSGLPTDAQGDSLPGSEPVSDHDPVHFLVQEVLHPIARPVEIAVGIEESTPQPAAQKTPQFDQPAVPSPAPLLLPVALRATTTSTPFSIAYGSSQRLPDPVLIAPSRLGDSALRLRFHELPDEQLQQVLQTLAETVIAEVEVADLADVQLSRAVVKLPELPKDYLEAPEEPRLETAAWRWYCAAGAGLALVGSLIVLIRPKLVQPWLVRRPWQAGLGARRKTTSVFAHSWW